MNIEKTNSPAEATMSKKPPKNKYAIACALLATMTCVLSGYDVAVMSGAQIYIQKNLHISDSEEPPFWQFLQPSLGSSSPLSCSAARSSVSP